MVCHRIEAVIMRYDNDGTPRVPFLPENVHDASRAFRICKGRRLVKHQNLRLANEHTGDADTLALATAQALATLTYHYVKAIAGQI